MELFSIRIQRTFQLVSTHLGNIESHFHEHCGRVLSESNGGRQDIEFQVLCSGKGAA